ncbi:MAG: type II secretion system minor pseudopilin GspK [Rubrivivax sp.]|nr:type II secretion system minor pseudopilin GspK [Rubrivivax sp.]
MKTPPPKPKLQRQRGAALLLAMIILVLITSVTAGMVWQQARAVQVESAERARAQAGWILSGALDWARLILREDARTRRQGGHVFDSLDEPWATPLAEARLSTFLAADKDNNVDAGPEAFISGTIVDAQSRFNLRGLIDGAGKVEPSQTAALQRLATLAGAPGDTAAQIADALGQALAPTGDPGVQGPPIKPARLTDLVWLGIAPGTLERLAPWVDLLPVATPVNANTAPREVLLAAIDGLDTGTAERLLQARQRQPFETLAAVQVLLPAGVTADAARVSVGSNWFEVAGRLRLEERVLEERSLVQREGNGVSVRRRERQSFSTPAR